MVYGLKPDELVLSDQELPMGRLGNRRESHSSEKFTRESSTEAPPERRKRRKKKSATIGKSLSLSCHRFWPGWRSRQAEQTVWIDMFRSSQRPSGSGERRRSQSGHRWRGSAQEITEEKVRKPCDQFMEGHGGDVSLMFNCPTSQPSDGQR